MKKTMTVLKPDEISLMKLLTDKDPGVEALRFSLQELYPDVFKSVGSVHRRLKRLELAGLVRPPSRPKRAKERGLTELGKETIKLYDKTHVSETHDVPGRIVNPA